MAYRRNAVIEEGGQDDWTMHERGSRETFRWPPPPFSPSLPQLLSYDNCGK
jgi:hypothetical protein